MDAEAAERRKCEKCVNHHETVCNKEEGEEKKQLPDFGDTRKKFLENRKRERGIYRFLFGISLFQALKQEKAGGTKWTKKSRSDLVRFPAVQREKGTLPPLKCVKNYDMICTSLR